MVLIPLFLLLILEFSPSTAQQQPISNISLGSSISAASNSYWPSNSGHFAFGFYPTGAGFAIGVWFARARPVTVLWTASRDLPPLPNDSSLVLNRDGRLILNGRPFLESPEPASSASLLDSGNFVLYGANSEIMWQSFDSPTDTLLPGQRLLAGQQLISSVSETNHSSGKFRLSMQRDGNLVQYPTDIPGRPQNAYWDSSTADAGENVTLNLDDDGHLYLLNGTGFNIKTLSSGRGSMSNRSMYRMTIDAGGIFRLYSHGLQQNEHWAIEWSSSNNNCDPTGLCGPNGHCTLTNGQETACECLPGFQFINPGQRSLGCNRTGGTDGCLGRDESRLQRIDDGERIFWQADPYLTFSSASMAACVDDCLQDCYCDAVVYRDGKCSRQNLPLRFRGGRPSDVTFVRVGTESSSNTKDKGGGTDNKVATSIFIAGIAFLTIAFIVLGITGVVIYKYGGKGYKSLSDKRSDGLIEDVTVRAFTFGELEKATKGFVEEVGRGSFGTVFKGVIDTPNGDKDVAVKRLEMALAEGEREFRNEVNAIGRTHHKNLVRLLGYCHDGTNRLLVYDFMSKGSLSDVLLNSKTKPKWEERVGIALNVAKGILYLHEGCETRIIHCDIKPANILMDDNNCPKISDFGLAKLMNPNQTRTRTGIRGTRGYVAPEWHRNLPITVKADVYSFGVVLLEIICGRRSLDIEAAEDEIILVDWVFECFERGQVGKLLEMEDEVVDKIKLERMVRVGLWCIQEEPSRRPSIQRVVQMLEGTMEVPVPPGHNSIFCSIESHLQEI